MIPYLSNLYAFKGVALKFDVFREDGDLFPHCVSLMSVQDLLIDSTVTDQKDVDFLFRSSEKIYTTLRGMKRPPTHSQMLQILAQCLVGQTYQKFKKKIPKTNGDFRDFWEIPKELLTSMMGASKEKIVHPFPPALMTDQIHQLLLWKNLWLSKSTSLPDYPFIPPIPPKEMFDEEVTYEPYCSWPLGEDFSGSEYFLIEVRNSKHQLIGIITWYFWGDTNSIKGVEFSFGASLNRRFVSFWFDLRPCNRLPTSGSKFKVQTLSESKLNQELSKRAERLHDRIDSSTEIV